MELLSVIRRWRYRDHYSIREISRRTGLSRNTVRKYLRLDSVEPKFNIPDRPSKLDPYADKLSHMLRQEAGKSRKQKRTIKQLHADLSALTSGRSRSRCLITHGVPSQYLHGPASASLAYRKEDRKRRRSSRAILPAALPGRQMIGLFPLSCELCSSVNPFRDSIIGFVACEDATRGATRVRPSRGSVEVQINAWFRR